MLLVFEPPVQVVGEATGEHVPPTTAWPTRSPGVGEGFATHSLFELGGVVGGVQAQTNLGYGCVPVISVHVDPVDEIGEFVGLPVHTFHAEGKSAVFV